MGKSAHNIIDKERVCSCCGYEPDAGFTRIESEDPGEGHTAEHESQGRVAGMRAGHVGGKSRSWISAVSDLSSAGCVPVDASTVFTALSTHAAIKAGCHARSTDCFP